MKFDSLRPALQEFKPCSQLPASLSSVAFWILLSLPLALIFQAILADKDVSVSALVVQLAFAQILAMTTMRAPPTNVLQDKVEMVAPSQLRFALMETFAQLIPAIPMLQVVVFTPTSLAMTTAFARTTTASDQLVARASKRFAMTTTPAQVIVAIQPQDVPSPQFLLPNATCAEMLFAHQLPATLSDARMEHALLLQFLATTETPALLTSATQQLEPAPTLQSIAMTTIFALMISAILRLVASTTPEMPLLNAQTTTFAQTILATPLLDAKTPTSLALIPILALTTLATHLWDACSQSLIALLSSPQQWTRPRETVMLLFAPRIETDALWIKFQAPRSITAKYATVMESLAFLV